MKKNMFTKKICSIVSVLLFCSILMNAASAETLANGRTDPVQAKTIHAATALGVDKSVIQSVKDITLTEEQERKTAAVYKNGKRVDANVTVEKVTVRQSGLLSLNAKSESQYGTYYILKASSTKTDSNNKDDVYAQMCWIDNFGPSNQLVSVSGSCRYDAGKTGSYRYSHDKVWGEQRTGYWTYPSFYEKAHNYKGYSFDLEVAYNGTVVYVSSSIFD